MESIVKTGYTAPIRTVARQEEPTKGEVEQLASMYEQSIDAGRAEKFMWNKMQQEGHMAIEEQVKKGEISERVAQIRGLMNDSIAHRAYQRIASQNEQDFYRYALVRNEYSDILDQQAG